MWYRASFLCPLALNSSKATFMGPCLHPYPMRVLLNKGSGLGRFNIWGGYALVPIH